MRCGQSAAVNAPAKATLETLRRSDRQLDCNSFIARVERRSKAVRATATIASQPARMATSDTVGFSVSFRQATITAAATTTARLRDQEILLLAWSSMSCPDA